LSGYGGDEPDFEADVAALAPPDDTGDEEEDYTGDEEEEYVPAASRQHTVVTGDTLITIANYYVGAWPADYTSAGGARLSHTDIANANNIVKEGALYIFSVGDILTIPYIT
jgi:nucleoid-associated protein YgaU